MKTPLLPCLFLFAALHCTLHAIDAAEPEKPAADAKPNALSEKIDFEALRRETGIAPIAVAPNAVTEADVQKEAGAWAQRAIVQPAKERVKGQKWAVEAAAFLDEAAAWWWTPARSSAPIPLTNEATALWDAGCRDPGVLYLCGLAVYYSYQYDSAAKYFDEVLKAVDEGKAPGALGVLAASTVFSRPDAEENKQLGKDFVRYLETAMKDGSFTEKEVPVLVRHWCVEVSNDVLRKHAEPLTAAIEKSSLPQWAQLTMLGEIEAQLAWKGRSPSSAKSESEKGFKEHLAKARTQFKESWKLEPKRPEAAANMIAVVLGLGPDEEDTLAKWFERATAAQFDYEPAYSAMLSALRPRRQGSYAHLLAFGDACLATRRFDTAVPGYFIQALGDIADEIPDWRALYRQPEVTRHVFDFMNGAVAEPSHRNDRESWEAYRAAFAWICGDNALAAQLMPNATFAPNSWGLEALRHLGVDLAQAFNESLILGGPAKSDFEAGESMRESKRWDDARLAYRAAREKSKGRTSYIDGQLGLVDFEQAYESGEWTKLPLGKSETSWARLSGYWDSDDNDKDHLICTGSGREAELIFRGRVPGDFEMRGHFAFRAPEGEALQFAPKNPYRSFGVLFGHSPLPCVPGVAHWWTAQCVAGFGDDGAAFLQNTFRTPRTDARKSMKDPMEADFHLTRRGDAVSFSLGEEKIFTDSKINPPVKNTAGEGPLIGIGASALSYGTKLEISALEVRKLGGK